MGNSKYSIKKIRLAIEDFFTKGHPRSIEAKKNIIASFGIKGISILISLLLVPMTIHYVNPTQYGIWLTLSSIVGWFSFFDIGFTNGFRNKFAAARSNGDDLLARHYVSTIYTALSLIFIALWGIFFITNYWLDWSKILNVNKSLKSEITTIAVIVFTYFCIQFVLRTIGTILTADQKPAKASLVDTLSQLLSLVIVFFLVHFTRGSLLKLSIALCISPIIVLSIANFWFFNHEYKHYKPSFKLFKFKYAKDILNLGLKFFIIQIAGIIQYQTANFFIAHFFGTYEVTSYNIAFKYFSTLNMIFSILLVPFWSNVTQAYTLSDISWIKNAKKKYLKIWFLFSLIGIIMLVLAPLIYNLWIGKGVVNIPFSVSLWSYIYIVITMFSTIHVFIINGIGAIKIQFYLSLITPLIYICTTYCLVKYLSFGIQAILIASVLANINGFIVAPIQCKKILKGEKSIWIK